MLVESYQTFIGFSIDITSVIEDSFYMTYACVPFNFYTAFYNDYGREIKDDIDSDAENVYSVSEFNPDEIRYYHSNFEEEEFYDVLTPMLADINFAWNKFLKHKNISIDPSYGLGFFAYYPGFRGRKYFCCNENCQLIFGRVISGSRFKFIETDESDSYTFTLNVPKNIQKLLAEFYLLVNNQQYSYKNMETEQFPIAPDFDQEIDSQLLSKYQSAIAYGIFGSCSVESY